jgi:hypothetical protein
VGSLYKEMTNLLANRSQRVIGSVISNMQSAFVKGRQIFNGIMVANEAVDEAQN